MAVALAQMTTGRIRTKAPRFQAGGGKNANAIAPADAPARAAAAAASGSDSSEEDDAARDADFGG